CCLSDDEIKDLTADDFSALLSQLRERKAQEEQEKKTQEEERQRYFAEMEEKLKKQEEELKAFKKKEQGKSVKTEPPTEVELDDLAALDTSPSEPGEEPENDPLDEILTILDSTSNIEELKHDRRILMDWSMKLEAELKSLDDEMQTVEGEHVREDIKGKLKELIISLQSRSEALIS
ncbi:MAG: hypothetical protein GY786_00235, partial [Proteobacteria bacterium]|nr:hypothetical protein [Pseudomonadota bacterium]